VGNLASLLEDTAADYPDRTAIVFGETRLSYARLDAAANQVANLLASRGVRQGDKVALSCPNVPCFTIVYYGILKAGATVVPLNILLKGREIAHHLADSDAKVYFAFEGSPELPIGVEARKAFDETDGCADLFLLGADPMATPWSRNQAETFQKVHTDDDDTAVILYTSGTTGQPKGAELRHRNMRDNALASAALFRSGIAQPDTYLCALPLFHSFGQTVIQNSALAFGGTIVLVSRFDAVTVLELMLSERITFFAGVPTMYWGLLGSLDEAIDVATLAVNLRVAVSGGAALPRDIHREFKDRFDVTILEGYGLSETSPVASFSVYDQEPRVGSIGLPIPGVEMKLIDEDWSDVADETASIGEIAIKGHNVMKGYYNLPAATADAIHEGWFRTGDLARKDEDGFYFIVERSKDMIIRGGFNVYPREIEDVLMTHPAVSLVAVIGVPHLSHGEEIKAVVVKKPHADISEDQLIAWAQDQLAAYKYPRRVEFVSSLPMTSTGKILKREL
jgi:long-chain acyl-CoA synthetase